MRVAFGYDDEPGPVRADDDGDDHPHDFRRDRRLRRGAPPRPPLEAHFTAVADATGLPVLIYDIPGRTGAAVATETLVRLAAHPRIVGVKDAKDTPGATSHVLAQTDLVFYCGTDMLNLPWLSLGAVGFVSVAGHVG